MRVKKQISAQLKKQKFVARAVCFLMIIMISALLLYMYLVNVIKDNCENDIQDYKDQTFERIYAELEILRLQSFDSAEYVAKSIENELKSHDLDKMKIDMDAGEVGQEMYNVINKHIRGVTLNNIDNYKNGIIVATKDGIVEDFNYERATKEEQVRTWDTEIENAYNGKLQQDAVNKLMIHSKRRIIATEKINYSGDNHVKISEMTKSNLKKVYDIEGLEGLRNYQIDTPAYITEHGDIFGEEDIVKGIKQDNHKLIIIQEFNLYDQLMEVSPDIFEMDNTITKIQYKYSVMLDIVYILGLFIVASVIILLFYFSHLYNYHTGNKKPEDVYSSSNSE